MPELPEMRALAERLSAAIGGAALQRAEPIHFAALKTVSPDPASLSGRTVEQVTSRGKYLLIGFGGPRIALHLSQGGRVDVENPPKATRPKFGVVRFRFEDAIPSVLIKEFGTERKTGWWALAGGDDGPMASLGPEPFEDEFASLIRSGRDTRRVHTLLRDQRTVAGIGRGYTDDILHHARLSPYASLASLDDAARETLLTAVHEILTAGLTAERRRTGGLPPKLGDHWIVHGRFGEPCPRCGTRLERVSYESREVAYCPQCQTGGRILADRRMSRLLK